MTSGAPETNMTDIPTASADQPNQPAGLPLVQPEVGEAIEEALPSLQQFIRDVPKQSDGFISAGDKEKLDKILKGMKPDEVKAKDDDDEGRTALHNVALRGLRGVVARLVKDGADVSAEDAKKNRPLHLCSQGGFGVTARELLKQGAKGGIDAENSGGETALHLASLKGRITVVKILLEHNASTNVLAKFNRSPLFNASMKGHLETVRLLLSDTNPLQVQTDTGRTPLHVAILNKYEKVTEELLKKGAETHICDSKGWTPLMTATKKESVSLMEILLRPSRAGQDLQLDTPDKRKVTPLKAAASLGFLAGVDKLIDAGAKCTSSNLEMQELLPAAEKFIKEDPNWTALNPKTLALLLRTASRWRYRNIVEQLLGLDNIRDCNTPNDASWGGLTCASFYGHANIVELFLENDAKIGLSVEEKGRALQAASKQGYDGIVKQLLDKKIRTPINIKDNDGMTALHHAISRDIVDVKQQDEKALGQHVVDGGKKSHTESEPGKHDEVVQLLLDSGAKREQKTKAGETALHHAVRSARYKRTHRVELILENMKEGDVWAVNEKGQTALALAFETASTEDQAANWAMEEGDGHNIARLILLKRKGRVDNGFETAESNNWSAIELAAYHNLPEVLALLLINSTSMKETMKRVDSAKELVMRTKKLATEAKSRRVASASVPAERGEHNEDDSGDDQDDEGSDPSEDQNGSNTEDDEIESNKRHLILDILNDPQIVIIKDSESYKLPQPERSVEGVPKDHIASIFQFYTDDEESSMIQRFRNVQQVVYDEGPKHIMEVAVESSKNIYGKMKSYLHIAKPETKKFTWVHFSSTNMVWMEDALKRIMIDDGYSKDQFRMTKSFFQDSWAEIPDKTSSSRFMRPRHSYKSFRNEEKTKEKGDKKNKERDGRKNKEKDEKKNKEKDEKKEEEKDEEKIEERDEDGGYANAIYIPYLSFAKYCRGKCSDDSENARNDAPHEKMKRKKLHEESHRCRNLLDKYKNRVIHGPSTLDEWYYHFAAEDAAKDNSSKDRHRRNKTQVVTKSLKDNTNEGDHWRLVRVNQLWVWVIGSKWLITATCDPIDGIEETLPQGIIDHIRKQARVRGNRSQPYTPFYMSKLLLDYCIGSYERVPVAADKEQLSIRQIFSNYINTIGREETTLFEKFSKFSSKTNDRRKLQHLLLDNQIREATEDAKIMSCEIKDIRDELNILKSVAKFQREVEKKLSTSGSGKAGFSNNPSRTLSSNSTLRADYVVDDISQMDEISDRIQSSISETLSLEQSEIANLQATLSVEQGKTLMIFTIVTIAFLPLSFLTSYFAMDTERFHQNTLWSKLVVFAPLLFLPPMLLLLPPVAIRPIKPLTDYMPNMFRRGKKHAADATRNTSAESEATPVDLGSRTPSEVEEASPAPSIRRRDNLIRRFRRSD
ncbi:unnamed protein product [Clonostachys rosea]|uniref:Ankyrin repeat protein n=1 Tax=Bionectria ochroleuca TaxID=29856 RepID=A0ABY6U878_BIOOC|nr:unnamed protein product [Clonostachys rosea]